MHRWDGGPSGGPADQADFDLDRGVAPGVKDLAADDMDDLAHWCTIMVDANATFARSLAHEPVTVAFGVMQDDRSLMILIAGPYRSGTGDDPAKMQANVSAMEQFALPLFRAGHIPIVGEWLALPLVELAGSSRCRRRGVRRGLPPDRRAPRRPL